MIIKPPILKKGDKIKIVSPAKCIKETIIIKAKDILSEYGYEVTSGRFAHAVNHLFAGTDQERTTDLQNALNDPDIKAIFCSRGGYGTTRILDMIDFSGFQKNPKWIVGFSDITALHCHIHNLGIESIHGTMPIFFTKDAHKKSLDSVLKILEGLPGNIKTGSHELNKEGSCNGGLVGGNLTMLVNLIGTRSDIDTRNKILFIEDIDEHLYRLDRSVVHYKRAGKLDRLAGLVVGKMTSMKENDISFGSDAYEIILEHTKEYDYPVCFNFPVGHEVDNEAIPCGRNGRLSVTKKGVKLKF